MRVLNIGIALSFLGAIAAVVAMAFGHQSLMALNVLAVAALISLGLALFFAVIRFLVEMVGPVRSHYTALPPEGKEQVRRVGGQVVQLAVARLKRNENCREVVEDVEKIFKRQQ